MDVATSPSGRTGITTPTWVAGIRYCWTTALTRWWAVAVLAAMKTQSPWVSAFAAEVGGHVQIFLLGQRGMRPVLTGQVHPGKADLGGPPAAVHRQVARVLLLGQPAPARCP